MNRRTESDDPGGLLPKAKVGKARPIWLLWLVPLGAAALCVWFLYRDFVATGPALTLYFHDADGLEAGNTAVKYRGTQIGVVKKLGLSQDTQSVKVNVRLVSSARNLARSGSVFWIVRPEVKIGAISGLRTIVSGEYIAIQPGGGSPTNVFMGADKEPVPAQPKSLHITLLSPNVDSLQEKSPIFYRGIDVGEVQSFQLDSNSQDVVIEAAIHEEYAPLVRRNTRFWNAGGIKFHFGIFRGAEISAESPATLLGGGLEFATPPEQEAEAANGDVFRLYDKPEDAWKDWRPAIALQLPPRAPETVTPPNASVMPK